MTSTESIQSTEQVIVPTPARLQKRMLKNLQAAANNKINERRAARAQQILARVGTTCAVVIMRTKPPVTAPQFNMAKNEIRSAAS